MWPRATQRDFRKPFRQTSICAGITAALKDFPTRFFPMKQQHKLFHENSPADESLLLIVIVFITGNDPGEVKSNESQNTTEHDTEKGPAGATEESKRWFKKQLSHLSEASVEEEKRFASRTSERTVSGAAWDFSNPEIVFICVSRDFVKQPSAYECP